MTKMNQTEKESFLQDLHVGVLALNDDGRGPLTAPLWYDYTPGGELWFIIGETSRKAKLLETGTRVGLAAQTEDAPYVYVSIEGPVTSIERATEAELLSMAQRYLGEAQGKAYADGSDINVQVTVRVQPEQWLAVDYRKMGAL